MPRYLAALQWVTMAVLVCSCTDRSADNSSAPHLGQASPPSSSQDSADPLRVLEAFEVGPHVYVRSLAVDNADNSLWVGTSVGVHEVNLESREVRQTLTRAQGLANEYVFTILADSLGGKWFGTNGGGVSRYHDENWRTYFPMHGLADYWVYALAQQSQQTLWIGTWAGVSRLNIDSGEFTNYVDELVNEWVYGIAIDRRQQIWFATEGGISMYDGTQWRSWTHKDGLGAPNRNNLPISFNTGLGTRDRHNLSVLEQGQSTYNPNYVFCVLVAQDDTVWAGTWGGGVSYFDGEKWTNYTVEHGLADNVVFSMAQDARGVFWFGTNSGLSRFDGKRWRNFGRAEGLLGESVYAVTTTAHGDVWVGTRGGVTRLGRELAPGAGDLG